MKTHTPGPWKVEFFPYHEGEEREELARLYPEWREITSEFDHKNMRVSVSGHIGRENAYLIAAAPDMLEVLKKVLDSIIKEDISNLDPKLEQLMINVIDKAEGRS
jgi:hypothetical protein